MRTTIRIRNPSDDDLQYDSEQNQYLRPPLTTTLKPFPQSIIQSIEEKRKILPSHEHSISDVRERNSLPTDHLTSDTRINIYPNESLSTIETPTVSESCSIEMNNFKTNRTDQLRRLLLDHRFGRRIHSSFSSSSATLRSIARRRSTQVFARYFLRRQRISLARNSKWFFIRKHLHDIAMMNKTYARTKLIEGDLRWRHLNEQICKHVLDMREILILRQQDDGKLVKSQKTSFDLKAIPSNEVVYIEHDGEVHSIGTRDLVLGRLIGNQQIQLDIFAHLDARRKFAIKQNLIKQKEDRNRLKKHIAFSFCICNLSLIVLMFAAMFIYAMKTFFELKSRQYL